MSKKADFMIFDELAGIFDVGVDDLLYNMCENTVDDLEVGERATEEIQGGVYSGIILKILQEHGYRHIEQNGGGEGGSKHCYGVFKLGGKIYKAEYSYYSYSGHEYSGISDTLVEVEPKTKTVTVYE